MDAFPQASILLNEKPNLPLAGLKVLDLTRLVPGPYATMILSDLGADVLKVEDPQLGDYMRWKSPFMNGESASFLVLNRNKRSITLNLKTEDGKKILIDLVKQADILLESFRPGVMKKLGVGYEQLKEVNPGLIYCAISGFGQTGPYSLRPGHDMNYIGYAGALAQTGRAGEGPVIPGVQIADLAGGSLPSLIGILAALQGRNRTGEGRMVDISMTDGVASLLTFMAGDFLGGAPRPERGKTWVSGSLPEYSVYETADGKWLAVAPLEIKFFKRLCELIDLQEYCEIETSGERADEIRAALAARFKEKTRQEWLDLLAGEETCTGPVNELDDVFQDPHLLERGLLGEIDHPVAGRIKQTGLAIKLNDLPQSDVMRQAPPGFGEHNSEVLSALGYSAEEIARFKEQGVI